MPQSKADRNKRLKINTAALRAEVRTRTKSEMLIWLRNVTGRQITAAGFEAIMRDHLPEESYYQTEVMEYIRDNYPGSFIWKAAAGPYSRQGIPDVCAVIEGHFFGFEIKRPFIGRLSKIQERTILEIQKAGGTAAVVSFWHQAKEVIEKYERSTQHRPQTGQ